MEDGGDGFQFNDRAWRYVRRALTCIGIALAAVGAIAIIALFFALWRRPSTITSVILEGDAQGPSDNNTLRVINPLDNVSCVDVPGTLQQCAWVDGAGRCNNPFCQPLNDTLGPVIGPTINGTYPDISLIPIGNGSTCNRCTYDIYGRVTNGTLHEFVPFNCTGGPVLCQAGRDGEGNVVLIQDGPTCLTNDTIFGGDVTNIWSNLTLVDTGVIPGCYGNATNNSINIPQPCVDSKGRITSITTTTFAIFFTNDTFALISTPNQTTVTDLGGNVLQVGTIQNNDKEADLQFKRILLSPHTSQTVNTVNSTYTLAILGTTGTSFTPLLGVYDTANPDLVPELQLGLWTDGERHPFISFNTYWEPIGATWVASKANTTGFVIFDPYAGGTLYFSATGNATTGNVSVALDVDIARMERSLFTSFVVFRVGVDPPSPYVGSDTSGIQISYEGDSFVDVPRLSMHMTYNGDVRPTFQIANADITNTLLLFDAYLDGSGVIRASTTSSTAAFINYGGNAFHFGIQSAPGLDGVVDTANETLTIFETHGEWHRPMFVGTDSLPRGLALTSLTANLDMAVGFGMYQVNSTAWRFGNAITPAYAWHKANDKMSLLRSAVAASGTAVIPSPLMFVSPAETAIYTRVSLYNSNADLWGFRGNVSTPEWQLYSDGHGRQNILLDCWSNNGTLMYTSTSFDGMRLAKVNNTFIIQELFGLNVTTGGFDSYQTLLEMHTLGTNWKTENTDFGMMGLQVRSLFGGTAGLHFGGYFDTTAGSLRSGVNSIVTYGISYQLGQWILNRCNAVTQGSLIVTCSSAMTVTTTGATMTGTLTVSGATTLQSTLGVTGATTLSSTLGVTGATTLSSTLGVTGATTLSSTLVVGGTATLNGSPQLSGPLEVGSGGTGSSDPMVGFKLMISLPPPEGPDGNGKIVESDFDAPSTNTSAAVIIRLKEPGGSGCPADGFQVTALASMFAQRFGDQVSFFIFTGFEFGPLASTCTFNYVEVTIPAPISTSNPFPGQQYCYATMGADNTNNVARTVMACLRPTATIRLYLSSADIPGAWTGSITWGLPNFLSFTYLQ